MTITIDRVILSRENPFQWLVFYSGGPDGARAVLSTITGSMITVAGENIRTGPFCFDGYRDVALEPGVLSFFIHSVSESIQAQRKEDRAALLRHAAMVVHGCKENLSADEDRKDLEIRYQTAF